MVSKDNYKNNIIKKFLRKLINYNIWGSKHTELKNLKKGIPKHLRGERIINECVDYLIKQEFIKIKISTYEKHISLNSEKKKEIFEFLKK